jgi:hypothetical protein
MLHLISDQWSRHSLFTVQLPIDLLPTQYQFTAFLINFAVTDRCDTDITSNSRQGAVDTVSKYGVLY